MFDYLKEERQTLHTNPCIQEINYE